MRRPAYIAAALISALALSACAGEKARETATPVPPSSHSPEATEGTEQPSSPGSLITIDGEKYNNISTVCGKTGEANTFHLIGRDESVEFYSFYFYMDGDELDNVTLKMTDYVSEWGVSGWWGPEPALTVRGDVWEMSIELPNPDGEVLQVEARFDCTGEASPGDFRDYEPVADGEIAIPEWKRFQNNPVDHLLSATEPILIVNGVAATDVVPMPHCAENWVGLRGMINGVPVQVDWIFDDKTEISSVVTIAEEGAGFPGGSWAAPESPSPTIDNDGVRYVINGSIHLHTGTDIAIEGSTTCSDPMPALVSED